MDNKLVKICLNCRGNWDECEGHKCICKEGVCCDVNLSSNENKKYSKYENYAFGYVLNKI